MATETKGKYCGCTIEYAYSEHRGSDHIDYCSLHDAAPETAAERDRLLAINAELLAQVQLSHDSLAQMMVYPNDKTACIKSCVASGDTRQTYLHAAYWTLDAAIRNAEGG